MGNSVVKSFVGIGLASILVVSVLSLIPAEKFGDEKFLLEEPTLLMGNAYADTIGDAFVAFEITHLLKCVPLGANLVGTADITISLQVEREATAAGASDITVVIRWTPHNAAGTHQTARFMLLADDVEMPTLTTDPPVLITVKFSLPSHDTALGHEGEFTLIIKDDVGNRQDLRISYPSCPDV